MPDLYRLSNFYKLNLHKMPAPIYRVVEELLPTIPATARGYLFIIMMISVYYSFRKLTPRNKVCAIYRNPLGCNKNLPKPEVIKLFSCSTQLSTKFQLLIKLKYRQIKKFLALSLSEVVFIMLINVKMPTIVGILAFMSRIDFVSAELSTKKFYNLKA